MANRSHSSPARPAWRAGEPPKSGGGIFLALMPDDAARAALKPVADSRRQSRPDWRARWVRPARYHAMLHFRSDHQNPGPDLVAAIKAAATKVNVRVCRWILDQVDSFRGREPLLVLRSAQIAEPRHRLWEQWRSALILAEQGTGLARRHTPHVTLACGLDSRPQVSLIEPVSWKVGQVVLIRREAGRPIYQTLARWRWRHARRRLSKRGRPCGCSCHRRRSAGRCQGSGNRPSRRGCRSQDTWQGCRCG